MSKSLLFIATPPPPPKAARLINGVASGIDATKPNPANDARAAQTKRLTADEEAAIKQAYSQHTGAATAALRAFRLAMTADRKNVMRALAKRYGVSPTAIERAVGTR
jgi:hypothetical protein